ncbi:MAG: outer membrane beta-barrel protein, partial [Chitinophagaceae bacterium]
GLRNDMEIPRWCYSAGFSAQYQLKPKLKIESGLLISDKGFQTRNIPVTTLENPDPVINFNTMRFIYHHYYLDIPIIVLYQFRLNDTYKIHAGAGICNSFNTDVYQTSFFTNASGITTRQKSTDKDRYNYQKYLLSSVLSGKIERSINEQISVSLEVRGQFSHSSTFKNSGVREHFWTTGLGFGVWYKM